MTDQGVAGAARHRQFFRGIVLITVAVALGFAGLSAHSAMQGMDAVNEEIMSNQVQEPVSRLQDALRFIEDDVRTLADVPPVQGIIRARAGGGYDRVDNATLVSWVKRMQWVYISFARNRKQYSQIRYLDEAGNEVVRINYSGTGEPVAVTDTGLQNKADRPYFIETMRLAPGQVYVSPLDLNREHGRIEVPYHPVQRLAVPIFDAAGARRGIVIINADVNLLIHALTRQSRHEVGFVFLTDRDGFFLHHDQRPELEWGGPTDLNTGNHLRDIAPEAAGEILARESGIVRDGTAGKFLFWQRVQVTGGGNWVVGVGVETWSLLVPVFRHFAAMLIVCALGLLIVLYIVRRMAREMRRYDEELQRQTARAEEANRAKSRFLATMSHELRTPLNAVIGFSEVLLAAYFGPLTDKQREYVKDILGSGQHLLALINDILDLSKVEAGKLEAHPEPFVLAEIIKQAEVMVRERAFQHKVVIALEFGDGVETVTADVRMVKQILFNLLTNAVKFTPEGGKVTVKTEAAGDEVQVTVRDTGIGIAEADRDKIFREFSQIDSSLSRKVEGTGLGLALTKKLVELNGGRIRFESAGAGQGTSFIFTLIDRDRAEPASGT